MFYGFLDNLIEVGFGVFMCVLAMVCLAVPLVGVGLTIYLSVNGITIWTVLIPIIAIVAETILLALAFTIYENR